VSSFHEHLREQTRALHRQLDSHPLMRSLVSRAPEREAYTLALRALASALQALEASVGEFEDRGQFSGHYQFAPRMPALRADLNRLGQAPGASLRPPPRFPSMTSLAGALYVMEGARLGGEFIAQRLKSAEGESMPCTFFAGDALPAQHRWQVFLAWAQEAVEPAKLTEASQSAKNTFQFFLDCFDSVAQEVGEPT
jgi:heme oxygenase